MIFPFLGDLCESHLIPSRTALKDWQTKKLSELCYLYIIGLRVLLTHPKTKTWARKYCHTAGQYNDFDTWRSDGNDLYTMLYALNSEDREDKLAISPRPIRDWLRDMSTKDYEPEDRVAETHALFARLDHMFGITDSSLRALRRIVGNWDDADQRERNETIIKLVQMVNTRAPSNSEVLPQLKKVDSEMRESASAGSTGAANVASVVGGIGAGFDPDGDWRSVYPPKKTKKPLILRR